MRLPKKARTYSAARHQLLVNPTLGEIWAKPTFMINIVPRNKTALLETFSRSIEPESKPVFIQYQPEANYTVNECYANVEAHVAQNGGSIVYGWDIVYLIHAYIEAEFHAVWRNNKGELIDVTPRTYPLSDKVLFLPSAKLVYFGYRIPNRRILFERNDKVIQRLNELRDREFDLIKKGESHDSNEIKLTNPEALELFQVQMEKNDILESLPARTMGKNRTCFCKSGLKYKECCQLAVQNAQTFA